MPRLSLYRPEKTNDYKFLDRNIKEMFVVGGTDLFIHKYLGIPDQGPSADLTQPQYETLKPTDIQDLLFLENRDRKYDSNIYRLRGHYNVQNLDFDLSQFGLFLNNDIIFITVHYNEMIELIGRKLIVGDVLELPHLTDYHPLNETLPIGLRRYYQVTDGNFASEGFTQTWYPHLWRIKCEPLVDSQEFSNILSQPIEKDNYLGDWDETKTYVLGYTVTYGDKTYTPIQNVPVGIAPTDEAYWILSTADTLRDIIGRYNKNIDINDAAIAEAARLVPKTGYDRSQLYLVPTFDGQPAPPIDVITSTSGPIPALAEIIRVTHPSYPEGSPAIRIGAEARKKLFKLTGSDADSLREHIAVTLKTAKITPKRLESGAGQVDGNLVLTAKAVGPIEGPFGTADNTYAAADNFPKFTVTSALVPVYSTVIPVQPFNAKQDIAPQIDVTATITLQTPSGPVQADVFEFDTRVVSVDKVNNTFTIDKATILAMPSGTRITIAASFQYEIQPGIMNFRADCVPGFKFIARSSPEGFGYTDGYMIGDGTAPNGLPTGAGIAFPASPTLGDYFLRIDYLPQLLFRWDGSLWVRISENVRATGDVTSSDDTQIGSFINNTETTTLTDGTVVPQQQPLSTLFKIQPD